MEPVEQVEQVEVENVQVENNQVENVKTEETEMEMKVEEKEVVEEKQEKKERKPPTKKPSMQNSQKKMKSAKLSAQLSQLQEQYTTFQKADSILNKDIKGMQETISQDLQSEKTEYLKVLEQQEIAVKEDANRRIFALVEEVEGAKNSVKQENASKDELRTKRKEINVKYANLKQPMTIENLVSQVAKFELLSEKDKRQIFKSLKIGYSQEIAKIELYKEERDSEKHGKIEQCQVKAVNYQTMLKQILPIQFHKEYATLQQIQDKKANVEQIFESAEKSQKENLQKMEQVKGKLENFKKQINSSKVYNQILSHVNQSQGENVNPMSYPEFEANQQIITEIKNSLSNIPQEAISQPSTIPAEISAEYETEQLRNLWQMVSKSQSDLKDELRKASKGQEERQKALESQEITPETEIKITKMSNKSDQDRFLARLRKYSVDPVWLQNQQSGSGKELKEKIENLSLFEKEDGKLMQVVEGKTQKENDYLQHMLSTQGLGNNQQTPFQNEFKNSDSALKAVKMANISVIDELNPFTKRYVSANDTDQMEMEQIISYNQYKINQIKIVDEESISLLEQMSSVKRDAWLNIYNNFLNFKKNKETEVVDDKYLNRQFASVQSSKDFYELFRNWEVKEYLPAWYEETNKYVNQSMDLNIDKDTLNRKKPEIDMGLVAEEMSDMYTKEMQLQSRQKESFDPEMEDNVEIIEREFVRNDINDFKKFLSEEVDKERQLMSSKKQPFDEEKPFAQNESLQEWYTQEMSEIEVATKEFEDTYGVKLHDGPQLVEFDKYDHAGQFRADKFGISQDDMLQMVSNGRHQQRSHDQAVVYERTNLKLIDDHLVRKIEQHLAGLSSVASEFGFKNENEIEKQMFDVENYDKYLETHKMDGLDKYSQQQQLVQAMKKQEIEIERALVNRDRQLSSSDDKKDMQFRSREEFERHRLQQQLKEAEDRLKAKHRLENMKSKGMNISNEALLKQIQIDSKVSSSLETDAVLNQYINNDVFSQYSTEQNDNIMKVMASQFKEFNLNQIIAQENIQMKYKDLSSAQTPLDTLSQPISSSTIVETAKDQELSPQDQRLAGLYQPDNKQREHYLRTKYQMYLNEQIRCQFASKILQTQHDLKQLQNKQDKFYKQSDKLSKQFNSNVSPKKAFDFIKNEKSVSQSLGEIEKIAERIEQFDPTSKDIENYNEELRFQIAMLEVGQQGAQDQCRYVIDTMNQNEVSPDASSHELMFKYQVDCGNNMQASNHHLLSALASPTIQTTYLQQFFDQSLKEDNFDGLAHLINYIETHQVNISESFDMSKFRSSLDFYLNHNFDLNKLMTFTRFYVQHVQGGLKINNEFGSTFGKVEDLVDMNALFSHLVDKIDTKTFIDPVSKVDPMMNIINFYQQQNVKDISGQSSNGTTHLSPSSVAKYLINHLGTTKSFNDLSGAVLNDNSDQLVQEVLTQLQSYNLKHKSLPDCFTEENVSQLYQQAQDKQMNERTAEYLLFLFKSLDMHAETIDLCENYQTNVSGYSENEQQSEIRNYYMSNALLKLSAQHDVIEKAVFEGKDEGEAYVSAMTKAYFKDGNTEHALKFFEEQIQKRRDVKEKYEDQLVSQFDSTFGQQQEGVNLSSFKQKYASLMLIRERQQKELQAISIIDDILSNCEKEEIENIFVYQMVMKEETQLLQAISRCSNSQYGDISIRFNNIECSEKSVDKFLKQIGGESGLKYSKELLIVKERKEALSSILSKNSKQSLMELVSVMEDGKIEIMGNVSSLSEGLKQIGVSESQYKQFKAGQSEQHQDIVTAIKSEAGLGQEISESFENNFMSEFNKSLETYTQSQLKKNNQFTDEVEEIFGTGWQNNAHEFNEEHGVDIEDLTDNLLYNGHTFDANTEELTHLKNYRDYLYTNPVEDQIEEENIKYEAYYDMVDNERDRLLTVMDSRKQSAMQMALKAFNKVQDMSLSTLSTNLVRNETRFTQGEIAVIAGETQQTKELFKQDKAYMKEKGYVNRDLGIKSGGEIDIGSPLADRLNDLRSKDGMVIEDTSMINETIEQYKSLLNNKSSPILSNFLHLMDYQNGEDITNFEEFNGDQYQTYIMHAERMANLMGQLDDMSAGMQTMGSHVDSETNAMKKTYFDKFDYKQSTNKKVEKFVQNKIESLYEQVKGEGEGNSLSTFDRQQKIDIVNQAVEFQFKSQQNEIFSKFFQEDMIAFGIQNNIPEAVHLGERLMSENGETMSYELAKAVKTYRVNFSQAYSNSSESAGPKVYNSKLYSSLRSSDKKYNNTALVDMQDPYWQDFYAKNYRHQDQYLHPSALAWDYNQNGILDKIVDFKAMEKKSKFVQNNMSLM